jgi:ABC-type lipoprotein export system ATPase subunit/bifunctional DNA-binding transcriptional regulator/antitoxin component of YhaV-PrlF toxin-antitoxin module
MNNPLFIQCENLIKIYQINDQGGSSDASLEVLALQGLDLTVAEGEMIGVVGASGSGKSTLLNILGGLDRPNGGRALVDKQDLGKLSQRGLNQYRRKTVGFIWQYGARNFIPYLTAAENIQLPMTLSGKVGKKPRQLAGELLDQICMGDRMDHRLEELSGGEQQRVAVAIALANQPRLLLADEPTGELDTATARTIYELLRDLNRKLSLTIVIVSHDPCIAQYVDRVVAVRDGKLASESVRISPAAGSPLEDTLQVYEELAILDSAGRLTIPREHLDQFHIRRRVRLEIVDKGILILPPANNHIVREHTPVELAVDKFAEEAGERRNLPAWLIRQRKYLAKFVDNLRKGTKNAE